MCIIISTINKIQNKINKIEIFIQNMLILFFPEPLFIQFYNINKISFMIKNN